MPCVHSADSFAQTFSKLGALAGVAQFHGVCSCRQGAALVMELAPCGSLWDVLQELARGMASLPTGANIAILHEVCAAWRNAVMCGDTR